MELNYKELGSGEPLIILHGLLGSSDNWHTLAKLYAEHFTVFIIDQRNHGKSPHTDDFSYTILTHDLLSFCEQRHIHKAHILGHSMGGKVAMQFALEHPNYVDKLVIADIAPVRYKPGHNEIFEALHGLDLSQVNSRKEVEEAIAPAITNFGVRQFLMKGLTRNDDMAFVWKFNLDSLWKNYDHILGTFQSDGQFMGKTLFINGHKSGYVLPEYHNKIEKHFPQVEYETIPKAGHWLHAEQAEVFFDKTLNFLT